MMGFLKDVVEFNTPPYLGCKLVRHRRTKILGWLISERPYIIHTLTDHERQKWAARDVEIVPDEMRYTK